MRCTSARDWGEEIQRSSKWWAASAARARTAAEHARADKAGQLAIKRKRGFERHQRLPADDPFANDRQAGALPLRATVVTSIPAARRCLNPRPATAGFGSFIATTTRLTSAKISAFVHGPVRPLWQHGSRLMYSVAPRAAPCCLQRDDLRVPHAVIDVESLTNYFPLPPKLRRPSGWGL